MIWQDAAMAIITIFTGYALLPQIIKGFEKRKVAITKQTGIISAFAMFSFAIIFFTIDMFLSCIISIIDGTLWLILLAQRIKYS